MSRFCAALALLLLLTPARAQENLGVSLSNLLRYGTGRESDSFGARTKDYLENLTDARLTFLDLTVGFRLLYDAPPEFGQEFQGLRKKYLEFTRDELSLRAGDSYILFGRGLAMNLFENRTLAYDTGLEGMRAEYTTPTLRLAAAVGDIRYWMIVPPYLTEHYRIRAGTVELQPVSGAVVGASFVSGTHEVMFPQSRFDLPEIFARFEAGELSLMAEYAEKRTGVPGTAGTHKGTGFYGTVSYLGEGFGVSAEYKDYRFGIADPEERKSTTRATRALAFQNAPIVHKEYSQTLLSRYPHVVDFSDEVGYHLDIDYAFGDQVTGMVSGAVSSRHYSFVPTGERSPIGLPLYGTAGRPRSWLPSYGAPYSPFWEAYADWHYYPEEGENDHVTLALNRKSEVQVAEDEAVTLGHAKITAVRSSAAVAGGQYTLAEGWVVKGEVEQQWVVDEKNTAGPRYENHLLSVGLSQSPLWSVTLRCEWSNDQGTIDGRKMWLALDGGYKLSGRHDLTLTVGADRGGQICANGVCREVKPFRGVRAGILSYF